jgi:MFS transporter, ACS family, D-galactonate transporter
MLRRRGYCWAASSGRTPLVQMPFGWLADKAGARVSLLVAVVWWSIFTAAARNVATFLGCRLLLGIGDAGAYPSCAKVTAVWFP